MPAPHERDVLAEWASNVFELVKSNQEAVHECQRDLQDSKATIMRNCEMCRAQIQKQIADLDKSISVTAMKVAGIIGGGVIIAEVVAKHFWK